MSLRETRDAPLPPLRARPVRFYSLYVTGGYLAEYVLHLREWVHSDDFNEPPVESLYAVQELSRDDHGWLGRVFLLLRLNGLPLKAKLYDDAGAEEGRVFCVRVPPEYGDRRTPGDCDCKGYRTFRRCSHLDCILRASILRDTKPLDEVADTELEAWLLGEAT